MTKEQSDRLLRAAKKAQVALKELAYGFRISELDEVIEEIEAQYGH